MKIFIFKIDLFKKFSDDEMPKLFEIKLIYSLFIILFRTELCIPSVFIISSDIGSSELRLRFSILLDILN